MRGRMLGFLLLATVAMVGSADAAPDAPTVRASVHAGGVSLRWTFRGTVTPAQTTMHVERAAGNAGFAPLTVVAAPRHRQTWIDAHPPVGAVQYRLQVVSDTGTSTWSNVAAVDIAGTPPPGPGPGPGPSGGPPLGPGQQECPAGAVDDVLTLVNGARSNNGVPPLANDSRLAHAARAHTIAMASSQNLTHDGWTNYIQAAGYSGRLLGENIAYGYPTASIVVRGWLGSSGHRANILDGGFTDSGVGCVVDPRGRVWWTQDFGG